MTKTTALTLIMTELMTTIIIRYISASVFHVNRVSQFRQFSSSTCFGTEPLE